MKNNIQHGHLQFLSDLCNFTKDDIDQPFLDFENYFIKYHDAVVMNELIWQKTGTDPYVMLKNLGVFTNINTLAKRIRKEIYLYDNKNVQKAVDVMFIGGDTLHIDFDDRRLEVCFIELNNLDTINVHDGYKFELSKATIRNAKIDEILLSNE